MKIRILFISLPALLVAPKAQAFPPAPPHTIFGTVRNGQGTPMQTGSATIILSGPAGEVVRSVVDTAIAPGTNYTLRVPEDSNKLAELYSPTAMVPTMPFTIRLVIGGVSYLPIQMQGVPQALGASAASTRLDLTVGVDSDGDGLPDAWEQNLIGTGNLQTLADIKPGDDADGDGMSNLAEYIAGTYAFDKLDSLKLEVKDVTGGMARLQFAGVTGRTYHLTSTKDGLAWSAQAFSLAASGASPVLTYRADRVTLLNVYVPVGTNSKAFFKLYVE